MNYNEYLKTLQNEVFQNDKSLLENAEVKHLTKMLYIHLIEVEQPNMIKHVLKDLIKGT